MLCISSLDSLNVCDPSPCYFPRLFDTFYPTHLAIHHYPNRSLLQWPHSSHLFAILSLIITCLFTFTLPIHTHKRKCMYASRFCNVPTSPPPLCSLNNNLCHHSPIYRSQTNRYSTKYLSGIAFIEGKRNLVDQVREQRLPRVR
jgi:hypothetical protein